MYFITVTKFLVEQYIMSANYELFYIKLKVKLKSCSSVPKLIIYIEVTPTLILLGLSLYFMLPILIFDANSVLRYKFERITVSHRYTVCQMTYYLHHFPVVNDAISRYSQRAESDNETSRRRGNVPPVPVQRLVQLFHSSANDY